MASSNRIPATVDARSAELLERAYALDNDADTRRLYRDWADTYDDTMLAGLGYLAPRLVSELLATATSDPAWPGRNCTRAVSPASMPSTTRPKCWPLPVRAMSMNT